MFPPVNTASAPLVELFVANIFSQIHPGARMRWLPTVFQDIDELFSGAKPEYAACDVRYHDLEHTLQAVVCLSILLQGRHLARAETPLDAAHFELAISAALLHDTGYIKLRNDETGTGAKYTYCHVVRSCAFAASYLPSLGAAKPEVETVLAAINCTGPTNEMSRLNFRHARNKVIGSALATADFLGQMAASDYPKKIGILYEEFEESDNFLCLPREGRTFKSAADLIEQTPGFWEKFVLPRLNVDFGGLYKFLAEPDGRNRYIESVQSNMVAIRQLVETRRHREPADSQGSVSPT
jgi:hypothetical protein